MDKKRWWFEGSGRSYSSMEDIVLFLEKHLMELVEEVGEEGSMLGCVPPYVFALVSLGESSGGSFNTGLDIGKIAKKVLAAHKAHTTRFNTNSTKRVREERELLESLFGRLTELTH